MEQIRGSFKIPIPIPKENIESVSDEFNEYVYKHYRQQDMSKDVGIIEDQPSSISADCDCGPKIDAWIVNPALVRFTISPVNLNSVENIRATLSDFFIEKGYGALE